MKYTLKRGLLGPKLVDESGNELDFNKKELKLRASKDGFAFISKNEGKTQDLVTLTQVTRTGYFGKSTDETTGCFVDVRSGKITEQFVDYSDEFIATLDGKLKKYDNNFNVEDTGYRSVVKKKPSGRDTYYPGFRIAALNFRGSKMIMPFDMVVAQDDSGKFGVVCSYGVACPFVFDSPNIQAVKSFERYGVPITLSFACDGQEVLIDKNGKIVEKRPFVSEYDSIYMDDRHEVQFSTYDEKKDKSTIYELDPRDGLKTVSSFNGKVLNAYKKPTGEFVYCVDSKTAGRTVTDKNGKVLLDKKYHNVDHADIRGIKNDLFFCIEEKTGQKNAYGRDIIKKGVFSISKGKVVLPPEYDDIDFSYSGVGEYDGVTKFFACKDNWGVVNENGQVEVDFEYYHDPSHTVVTQRVIKDKRGNHDYVDALEIEDKKGRTRYFNITQKNIVATKKEEKGVEEYERMLAESSAREDAERRAEKAKSDSDRARRAADARRREHEDRKTSAAIGASILTGSPIAGMIVSEIIDEIGLNND